MTTAHNFQNENNENNKGNKNSRQDFHQQDIGYLLTAYADGQLAPAGVMWVEEQLDRNVDLRAKLKEICQLQSGLRQAFSGKSPEYALELPRREALLAQAALAQAAAAKARKSNIISFKTALRIAFAASLLLCVWAISIPNLLDARPSVLAKQKIEPRSIYDAETPEALSGNQIIAAPSSSVGEQFRAVLDGNEITSSEVTEVTEAQGHWMSAKRPVGNSQSLAKAERSRSDYSQTDGKNKAVAPATTPAATMPQDVVVADHDRRVTSDKEMDNGRAKLSKDQSGPSIAAASPVNRPSVVVAKPPKPPAEIIEAKKPGDGEKNQAKQSAAKLQDSLNDQEVKKLREENKTSDETLRLARAGNNEKTNVAQVAEAVALQLNVKLAEVENDYNNVATASAQLEEAKKKHALEGERRDVAVLKERYPKIANDLVDEKQSTSFFQGVIASVRNNPQAEQDLLVVTIDQGDKVSEGTEFIVSRDNNYIVRVRAEKIDEGMVVCRVIPDSWNSKGLKIQSGDLLQNRLGDASQLSGKQAYEWMTGSAKFDPQNSLATLMASATHEMVGRFGELLWMISSEKIAYQVASQAQALLTQSGQVQLHDEPVARGVLRIARSAGLQAQFTGGIVHLDVAQRPLDPTDSQGFELPTFRTLMGTSPMQAIAKDPIQTVAIDADTASYAYAKARIAAGEAVDAATIKPEHFINAMPMEYPKAQGPEAFSLFAEAAPSPFARAHTAWGARTALVSIGAVAKPAAADERRPLALTLAVDCSGSMAQPGALERIKVGLQTLISNLRAEDRVSIVAFGDQARLVLPATPGNDPKSLLAALHALTTGGATNAAEGLTLAYQLAAETAAPGVESRVLLATDGGTVAGAEDLLRRVTAFKDRGITLVVVGCGQTYRAGPLQELATKGDGQHFFVGSDDEAQKLFSTTLLPDRLAVLAKDAKLQVTWNPQRISHARLIGYDQRRLAAKDFRNNSVDAGELSQDTQVTALFEVLLVDGGTGPLGNAAVRYYDTRREQVRELACPLPGSILANQPSDRLRLLACAAATAEWLQQGWWSNVHLITPAEIKEQLSRCPQPIAAELRKMVEQKVK